MATTAHRPVTIEHLQKMFENGELSPDARVELIEGEIIFMQPPGPFHSYVVDELVELFTSRAAGRWRVRSQGPLKISDETLVVPDVMMMKPGSYRSRQPQPEDVYLLVEVSDSTLRLDRLRKIPLHAKAQISELWLKLWLINLKTRSVDVYREPTFHGFASKSVHNGGNVAPTAFPDVKISVAELLAAAE